MNSKSMEKMATDLPEMLTELLAKGAQLGRAALTSVAGGGPAVTEVLTRPARRMLGGSCEIPTPCWMPQELGKLTSYVCGGGTASLHVAVTNCDDEPRIVKAEVTGTTAKADIQPGQLSLGPMEEGVITVSLMVPEDAVKAEPLRALVWIRGCKVHFLRWTVKMSAIASDSAHEVRVEDCPDLIHHWYDHFYCVRPCRHQGQRTPIHA
jgi:hypothetical protein